jgi:hypothetical protein
MRQAEAPSRAHDVATMLERPVAVAQEAEADAKRVQEAHGQFEWHAQPRQRQVGRIPNEIAGNADNRVTENGPVHRPPVLHLSQTFSQTAIPKPVFPYPLPL